MIIYSGKSTNMRQRKGNMLHQTCLQKEKHTAALQKDLFLKFKPLTRHGRSYRWRLQRTGGAWQSYMDCPSHSPVDSSHHWGDHRTRKVRLAGFIYTVVKYLWMGRTTTFVLLSAAILDYYVF